MDLDRITSGDITFTMLIKGTERYLVYWSHSEAGRSAALRHLGRWASNPELSFSWSDAAVLGKKIRDTELKSPPSPETEP